MGDCPSLNDNHIILLGDVGLLGLLVGRLKLGKRDLAILNTTL